MIQEKGDALGRATAVMLAAALSSFSQQGHSLQQPIAV